jgi:hypothetical protein
LNMFLWGRKCGECIKQYIWEALVLLYYLTLHLHNHWTFFQPTTIDETRYTQSKRFTSKWSARYVNRNNLASQVD